MVASTVFLHGAGYGLGMVSTEYRHRVEEALERDGRRAFVEVVVGSDDVPPPKPAPNRLPRAGGASRTATGDCVFMGDPEVDAKAAQNARMGFVAVLTEAPLAETFAGYASRSVFAGVGRPFRRNCHIAA